MLFIQSSTSFVNVDKSKQELLASPSPILEGLLLVSEKCPSVSQDFVAAMVGMNQTNPHVMKVPMQNLPVAGTVGRF
jgi:hypothetical protein